MDLVQADFVGNARVYSDESSNREFERIFGFPPQLIRDGFEWRFAAIWSRMTSTRS